VGLGNLLSDEDMKLVEQYAEVQVQSFASDLEDAMANAESYCGLAGGVSLANGAPTVALGQVTTTHPTPYLRCPSCVAPSRPPQAPLQAFRCCRRVARAACAGACAGRVLWARVSDSTARVVQQHPCTRRLRGRHGWSAAAHAGGAVSAAAHAVARQLHD